MTAATEDQARVRAPLALQVSGLLLASLLASQAVALAIVILTPPPRPPIYALAEVADALSGGPLRTRLGRPLVRTIEPGPPTDGDSGGPMMNRQRLELSSWLQIPPGDVRLRHPSPSLISWLVTDGLEGRRPPPPGLHRPGRDDRRTYPYERWRPLAAHPPDPRPGDPTPMQVFGPLTAAVRANDGRWIVVRSSKEPFPTKWQRGVCYWFLACIVIVGPTGFFFARRITAPLNRFAEAAQRLGLDPRAPPLTLSGPAEIGRAARAFNDMQDRLKRYVDDRTGMVGAISHDLRTPLTRIRFKMEAQTPDKAAILSDVEQMEEMISSVLTFIRGGGDGGAHERIDLLSLVESAVDDAALIGRDVRITQAEDVVVHGDIGALQRTLTNLLDNALKYGSRAEVRIARSAGSAVVEVEDDGPGLDRAEWERVFKPFFRTERARTLDGAGVGLGLSIARSIARAHGGDVNLDVRSAGLVAILRLPLGAP